MPLHASSVASLCRRVHAAPPARAAYLNPFGPCVRAAPVPGLVCAMLRQGRASPTQSVTSSYRGDYDDGDIAGYNMGGQGLAGTWAKSDSGVAETFISMWLSSLILHVHPKK